MSAADAGPAPVFAALGDATRLALVARLSDGRPWSIAQLSRGLGLTRQGVTKHLRVLEAAGIVASRRSGRESRFTARMVRVGEARRYLDRVAAQWDGAAARLEAFLETDDKD